MTASETERDEYEGGGIGSLSMNILNFLIGIDWKVSLPLIDYVSVKAPVNCMA